jgi:glycosyltransferase involved in cell wall biosynthesis
MPKPHVLLVTHDLKIGGLQRVVVDLACGLNKEKFGVSVCVLREGSDFEDELSEKGIRVIRPQATAGRVDYFAFWKLYKIFRAVRPTIVHTHNTQPFVEGGLAAVMARVPVIVHTDHGRKFPDKRRYMFAEWVMSHFVKRLVGVSEATKAGLVKYERIPASRIQVILNGIDGDKYEISLDPAAKRKELGIDPESGPLLGWCGRLSSEKGLTYLLQALRLLKSDFPKVLLLLAGEGELLEELRQESEAMGLERHVRFLGARHDVHEILRILDLFVLPSVREGLPLVLLEAMAASLPIVATGVGGIREAVEEGVNGLVVKPQDPSSLYHAMKQIFENKETRDSFSRRSHELFQSRFSVKRMVEEYETIYGNCFMSPGGEREELCH